MLMGTWPSPSPHWMSYTGTSMATRCTRFFSATSIFCTRAPGPSDTSTTPGKPTARCTTSWSRVTATCGVTSQLPRMLCMIAAAAPGWPSSMEYCARWASCPKTSMPTVTPSRTPMTMSCHQPVTSPMTTKTATVASAEP